MDIRVTDTVITRTATAIIRMATTDPIRTTTILGRHTTGPMVTATIATTVIIILTIGTKLT